MKRSLRGLYVIRGGAAGAALKSTSASAEELRAKKQEEAPDDGRLATLEVNFSKFDSWYRIDSWLEGTFLERTVKGAFKQTIAERGSQVKILFNHGMDMLTGDRPLSVPEVIEERADGPYLEGPLLDTSYNRDLLPGLRAGAYGSSFMFEVLQDEWNEEPERSEHNPDGIPERTIKGVRLFEAGPVTWPANPESTAGVRSGAEWYADKVAERDAEEHQDLVRSFSAFRALHGLQASAPAPLRSDAPDTPAPSGRHVTGMSPAMRRRRLSLLTLEK